MVVPKRSKITAKVSWGHPRVVFTKDENKYEITVAHEQLFGLVSAEFCVIFFNFTQFSTWYFQSYQLKKSSRVSDSIEKRCMSFLSLASYKCNPLRWWQVPDERRFLEFWFAHRKSHWLIRKAECQSWTFHQQYQQEISMTKRPKEAPETQLHLAWF